MNHTIKTLSGVRLQEFTGVHAAGRTSYAYPSELVRTAVNCNPNCKPGFSRPFGLVILVGARSVCPRVTVVVPYRAGRLAAANPVISCGEKTLSYCFTLVVLIGGVEAQAPVEGFRAVLARVIGDC
jgi:hypothetical protein